MEGQGSGVDDVCGLSGTHIDHFYIIVGMSGKMNKTGMGAHLDQLAVLQHFAAVNNKRGIV